MKSLIAVIALVVSANSFAYSFADSTVLTIASPFITSLSSMNPKEEANRVLNDVQDFMQSGVASPVLAAKIASLQDSDDSISQLDAVGLLTDNANEILAN